MFSEELGSISDSFGYASLGYASLGMRVEVSGNMFNLSESNILTMAHRSSLASSSERE